MSYPTRQQIEGQADKDRDEAIDDLNSVQAGKMAAARMGPGGSEPANLKAIADLNAVHNGRMRAAKLKPGK